VADDYRDAGNPGCQPLKRRIAATVEIVAQQQVLGGVAAHCELRRDEQIDGLRARTLSEFNNARDVAGKIAKIRIDVHPVGAHRSRQGAPINNDGGDLQQFLEE